MTAAEFQRKRHSIGWTQLQTAKALFCTPAHISQMEGGRRAVMPLMAAHLALYQLGDWPGQPSGFKKETTA